MHVLHFLLYLRKGVGSARPSWRTISAHGCRQFTQGADTHLHSVPRWHPRVLTVPRCRDVDLLPTSNSADSEYSTRYFLPGNCLLHLLYCTETASVRGQAADWSNCRLDALRTH